MNLKFAGVSPRDPLYSQVVRIKQIIQQPQLDFVINLHDGSGFYHPERLNEQRNPDRWGQCCVIDQARLPGIRFGELQQISERVIEQVNRGGLSMDLSFHLKNVQTRTSDEADATKKSLSFFAVRQNKPAVAIEASKAHPVHLRTYYHLVTLEAFMQQLGIEFTRDFTLTPEGVGQVIRDDALLSLADGRIQLDLNNMRDKIRHLPLPRDAATGVTADNPLVTLLASAGSYRIHYGNNRLAVVEPQFFGIDRSINAIDVSIDGNEQEIPFGSIIPVNESFMINNRAGYRVNVIGFVRPGEGSDGRVRIGRSDLDSHYSIDKAGLLYRVEIYRGELFSGMLLVDFRPQSRKIAPLVAHTPKAEDRDKTSSN